MPNVAAITRLPNYTITKSNLDFALLDLNTSIHRAHAQIAPAAADTTLHAAAVHALRGDGKFGAEVSVHRTEVHVHVGVRGKGNGNRAVDAGNVQAPGPVRAAHGGRNAAIDGGDFCPGFGRNFYRAVHALGDNAAIEVFRGHAAIDRSSVKAHGGGNQDVVVDPDVIVTAIVVRGTIALTTVMASIDLAD